jgi:hypothetical protein
LPHEKSNYEKDIASEENLTACKKREEKGNTQCVERQAIPVAHGWQGMKGGQNDGSIVRQMRFRAGECWQGYGQVFFYLTSQVRPFPGSSTAWPKGLLA